jgi:peptidyl-prolyl cis-trans isomerase D
MFDFTQRHKRLIQIVLAIIFLPFAFFGVDSYFRHSEGSQGVATVGGHTITQAEFSKALQERQRALQRSLRGQVDPAMLDTAEIRTLTLEALVQRRVLLDRALRSGMAVSDAQLKKVINELPPFQDQGAFSYDRYQQFLKAEGETPTSFEAKLRQDLILQQMSEGYADTSFVPRTVTERLTRLAEQQREVAQLVIAPEHFVAQVKLEPDAAQKYYEANRGEFEVPEQIRLEYVVLSIESLMQQVQVDSREVEKFYATNRAQFEKPESRARHILIAVDPAAGAEAKQKARATAEDLYKQLQKKPASFPDLAKQHSQDPGSAANGGDLGFLGRGAMKEAPQFEDALFALKEGEISKPVETRFGFHIIQATEVKGAGKPLEEVRGLVEAELKRQTAARMFAEVAEKFNNTVYEQSESLKPAAELAKVATRQSGWVMRTQAADPVLNNPRLLQAVFSEDVLKNKRNTEAIEVSPGTLVAARVSEHKPAAVQPFAEVKAAIEKKLTLREAGRLAAQDGKAKLDLLKQGKEAPGAWSAPQVVTRSEYKPFTESVARQAFRVDAGKLPGYAGVEGSQGGGYTVVRVTRVVEGKGSAEIRQEFGEAMRRLLGQEELGGYVASLKQKAGVKVSKDLLEKKEK